MTERLSEGARFTYDMFRRCRTAVVLAAASMFALSAAAESLANNDKNLWRIGFDAGNPPLSFASKNGAPDGFAFDLFLQLIKGSTIRPVYVVRPWPILYQKFLDGKIDVLATASFSPGKRGDVVLSAPYIERHTTVFHRANLNLGDPVDLQGLRLAAVAHSEAYDYLASQNLSRGVTKVENLDEGLELVDRGGADAVLGGRTTGFRKIRELGLRNVRVHQTDIPGIGSTVHFGVHPSEVWRLSRLNDALAQTRDDGSYRALREQWYGAYDPPRRLLADLIPYLAPSAVLVVLAAGAYLGQRKLYTLATQSEERLNLVLEGSHLAFWDWDLNKKTFSVSPRWYELTGADQGSREIGSESVIAQARDEDQPSIRRALDGLSNNGIGIDLLFQTASGQPIRWLRLVGSALRRDGAGQILRAAGTLADVTGPMDTHNALRAAQAHSKRTADLLRLAEQAAHIGAWELNPSSGRITLSEEGETLLRQNNTSATTFTVESFLDCLSRTSADQAKAALHEAVQSGDSFDLELNLASGPGGSCIVRWIGLIERSEAGVTRIYGSLQDVSDRHKRENERAATLRRLLEAQRREGLGTLAGGIAHDFNNLLTVILSNASLAKLDAPTSNLTGDPLGQIEYAATRAAGLCKQMLIYAGQAPIDPKPVFTDELLEEMRTLFDVTVGRRNRLTLELGSNNAAVLADHRQLRQLILSIVQNAAEACPVWGGSVRIACSRTVLTAKDAADFRPRFEPEPGPVVCMTFVDDGVGMSADVLDQVFEPFFTTKFAGRGLGLAAAHGIVRAHRGAISVESEPHKGTIFRVFLPIVEVASKAHAPDHPSQRMERRQMATLNDDNAPSLLVVDEDVAIRSAVAMLANRLGLRCLQAADAAEAFARFSKAHASISTVLVDATKPDLVTEDFVARIRGIKPGVRFLFMSDYHESGLLRPPNDPLVEWLTKPFTAGELASLLRHTETEST